MYRKHYSNSVLRLADGHDYFLKLGFFFTQCMLCANVIVGIIPAKAEDCVHKFRLGFCNQPFPGPAFGLGYLIS